MTHPRISRRWLPALMIMLAGSWGCGELPGGPGSNSVQQPEFVRMVPHSRAGSTSAQATISSAANFNGTAIPAGRVIWFNSVLAYTGSSNLPVTFHVTQGSVQFSANGTTYSVPVPNATVVLSPTATSATSVYDATSQCWVTTAPFNTGGSVFLSAVAWKVPVNLPGGIKPVTWQAQFTTDTPGANFKWKWAAAVYNNLSSRPDSLGVKPVDSDKSSLYPNSDHAGTPENFRNLVTGGATGGGGSNYTGSLSGDLVVVPAPSDNGPLNGSAQVDGNKGGTLTVGRFLVTVPPHAFNGTATIGISVPDQAILQCNLSITPASANAFLVPVVLSSDYSGGAVADPNSLVEVWFDVNAGVWRQVPGSAVDTANKRVLAPLSHFSSYGVAIGSKAGW